MVGPSLSDDDRAAASRRLKLAFAALVGVSGSLVALASGATAVQALLAGGGGLLVGGLLVVYLGRVNREWRGAGRR